MFSFTSASTRRPMAVSTLLSVLCTLFFAQCLFATVDAASADEWRSRSIYQIVTDRFARGDGDLTAPCGVGSQKYCGGNFRGIINQLDYIQGMGFTAIWISPVTTNVEGTEAVGDPYHGFWPKDLMSINDHFGTAADLKELSAELHKRGMFLMVDVVLNNMASTGPAAKVVYSDFHPFDTQAYFHAYCEIADFGNWPLAQDCWLSATNELSLPDLNTENPLVIKTAIDWATSLVSNYSIDGFRVDAAKHIPIDFWGKFQPAVDIFMTGEVFDGSAGAVCSYQANKRALEGVLNFAMWYGIKDTITDATRDMRNLTYSFDLVYDACQDTTLLGTFSENHDVGRIANLTSDVSHHLNALAWMMLSDGMPVLYYGAEQGLASGKDPWNREALWLHGFDTNNVRYKLVQACNVARNAIANLAKYDYWTPYWTWKSKIIYSEEDVVAVRKGYDYSVVTIVSNRGSSSPEIGPITFGDTNFIYGDTIVELIGCTTKVVEQYGNITITLPAGAMPQVWMPAKYVWNSTLCKDLDLASYKDAKSAIAVIAGAASDAVPCRAAHAVLAGLVVGVLGFFTLV